MSQDIVMVENYIAGAFTPPSTVQYLDVENPADMKTIGKVGVSNAKDVDAAVAAAKAAFPAWSGTTIKARAAIVSVLYSLTVSGYIVRCVSCLYYHFVLMNILLFTIITTSDDEIPRLGSGACSRIGRAHCQGERKEHYRSIG